MREHQILLIFFLQNLHQFFLLMTLPSGLPRFCNSKHNDDHTNLILDFSICSSQSVFIVELSKICTWSYRHKISF